MCSSPAFAAFRNSSSVKPDAFPLARPFRLASRRRFSFGFYTMKIRSLIVTLAALCVGTAARADEGMWLYSAPPRAQIKAKYGFDLTDAWLNHVRLPSVRFNTGGPGPFVPGDGPVFPTPPAPGPDQS